MAAGSGEGLVVNEITGVLTLASCLPAWQTRLRCVRRINPNSTHAHSPKPIRPICFAESALPQPLGVEKSSFESGCVVELPEVRRTQ